MNDLRLGAARKRLSACSGQADAIEAVREIVSNFLGSEEMALFDLHGDKTRALWSFGAEAEKCNLLEALNAKALDGMVRGECQVQNVEAGRFPSGNAQAFVPLCLGGRTVGVLAILQLLPQKAGFDAADMRLLKLLSDEAGKALFDSEHAQNK